MDLQAIIEKDDIRIEVDVPKELQIKGVLAYLESVVLNLVSNAIKYRDPKKKDNFVSITAFEEGQTIMLKVADNGLGIDLEKYGQKLFGMYKVFHGNKDARGIGLFITKNQIESMGGSISVESIPLKGTTFCVTFVKD
jgi:signal transduction histidine kinase